MRVYFIFGLNLLVSISACHTGNVIYPLLARAHYSYYITTYKVLLLTNAYYISWIMYYILLTLQLRSNTKYKIDSLLVWLGIQEQPKIWVKFGWVIFEIFCMFFSNHLLRNLDWPWEFLIRTVSCSLLRCIYFCILW